VHILNICQYMVQDSSWNGDIVVPTKQVWMVVTRVLQKTVVQEW